MEPSARHVYVRGDVQGVGFRWATQERARGLGLAGWVRNLPDGRVEVWLEGPSSELEAMLTWLRRGPPLASVSALEGHRADPEPCAGFEVRRGPRT